MLFYISLGLAETVMWRPQQMRLEGEKLVVGEQERGFVGRIHQSRIFFDRCRPRFQGRTPKEFSSESHACTLMEPVSKIK